MVDYFSEALFRSNSSSYSSLTPDSVISKIIYFRDQAHLIHFQTTSFEVHKNFDGLYSALDEWVDKIGELLLGYIAPKRFGQLETIKLDSKKDASAFIKEGIEFADKLYGYGESTEWWELSNMAADLSGDFRKSLYLSTLT